jgi:predicted TIM-barrel fold metal-dependent hydrolase
VTTDISTIPIIDAAALAPRDHIRRGFADLPEADVRKVMYENAARLYHLDCPG